MNKFCRNYSAFCAPTPSYYSSRHRPPGTSASCCGGTIYYRPLRVAISRGQLGILLVSSLNSGSTSPGSSLGRGEILPKRLVSLSELENMGIEISKFMLLYEDGTWRAIDFCVLQSSFFFTTSETLQSMGRFAVASIPAIWAILYWIKAADGANGGCIQRALHSSRRVAIHEAGHFLVAYLLGFSIESYSFPTLPTIFSRNEVGLRLKEPYFYDETEPEDAYLRTAVRISGIAAEFVLFGDSKGGNEDLAKVNRTAAVSGPLGKATVEEREVIVRWALMQAVSLIKTHNEALEKLADAMVMQKSAEVCAKIIDDNVNSLSK